MPEADVRVGRASCVRVAQVKRGDRVVVVAPNKDQLGETGVIIERFVEGVWRIAFDTATRPCRDCGEGRLPLVKLMSATVLQPADSSLFGEAS